MYGQLLIGAPGSGKSTYCSGMEQLLQQLGRSSVLVNLDPANDVLPYKCDIDIRELITVEEVMERLKLGPNGALRYCMHTLKKNIEWLKKKLSMYDGYLLIDLPGQLELYNSDDCIKDIIRALSQPSYKPSKLTVDQLRRKDKASVYDARIPVAAAVSGMEKWGHQIVAVHLSDSLYCSDSSKFIAVVLAALSVMVNLEVSQLNVLSKMDLVDEENLPYDLEYFKQIPDLRRLADLLNDNEVLAQYKGLNKAICSVITDYDLVNFVGLDVMKKESMMNVLQLADTANGYALAERGDLREMIASHAM